MKIQTEGQTTDNRQTKNSTFSSSELKQSKVLVKQKIRGGLSVMSPHCFDHPLTIVLGIALRLIRVKFYALFIYHFFPMV